MIFLHNTLNTSRNNILALFLSFFFLPPNDKNYRTLKILKMTVRNGKTTAFKHKFLASVTQVERKFGLLRLAHVTYRRKAALCGTCCQDREIHFIRLYSKISNFLKAGVNTFLDYKLYTSALIPKYREIPSKSTKTSPIEKLLDTFDNTFGAFNTCRIRLES